MFSYQIPLAKRIKQGGLKTGYDIYNRKDVSEICPTICATSFLCVGRSGHVLIFEDETDLP